MATMQQYQPVAAPTEKPRGVGAKLKSVLSGLTGNKTFTGVEELPAAPTYQLPAPSRPAAGLQAPLVLEGAEIRSEVGWECLGLAPCNAWEFARCDLQLEEGWENCIQLSQASGPCNQFWVHICNTYIRST